jgi:ferredoxin
MPCAAKVDKRSCLSSGRCAEAAPEVFALDEDHLAEVRGDAALLSRERLLAIARACPAIAISVYDEDGREIELA